MPKLIRIFQKDMDISHLSQEERAELWILFGDVGQSSKAIWGVMKQVQFMQIKNYPRDVADLSRCMALLEAVPEWKVRMPEMAKLSPVWKLLSDHWAELTRVFMEEEGGKRMPKTWDLLDRLIKTEDTQQ